MSNSINWPVRFFKLLITLKLYWVESNITGKSDGLTGFELNYQPYLIFKAEINIL